MMTTQRTCLTDPIRASSLSDQSICQRRAVGHQLRTWKVLELPRNHGTTWATIAGSVTHGLYYYYPGEERDLKVERMIDEERARAEEHGAPVMSTKVVENRDACVTVVKRNLRSFDHFPPLHRLRDGIAEETVLVEHLMHGHYEGPCFDRELTGHLDIYDMEQELLIDIKCSGSPKRHMPLEQMGQYIHLLDAPVKECQVWALRFKRSTDPGEIEVLSYSPEKCTRAFEAALMQTDYNLRLYEWRHDLNDIPGNYEHNWACSAKWCSLYGTPHCKQFEDAPLSDPNGEQK